MLLNTLSDKLETVKGASCNLFLSYRTSAGYNKKSVNIFHIGICKFSKGVSKISLF